MLPAGLAAVVAQMALAFAPSEGRTLAAVDEIRVAVFAGEGAIKPLDRLTTLIESVPGFKADLVTAEGIRADKLAGHAAVIFPGGLSTTQSINLGEDGKAKVREFVKNGGGYVGICAGSYLASCAYKWSLRILDADVVDKVNWARGTGQAGVKIGVSGQKFFGSKADTITIYYGQGPLLVPGNDPALPDYEELAAYETDITKAGSKSTPGAMKGKAAAVRSTYGAGRVFCWSPHPEKTDSEDAKEMMRKAIAWAAGRDR